MANAVTGTAVTETAVKETKAQRVERLKREKNPWEGLDDIRKFAREGFDSITPEWLGTYFRWWGVYTQGDGVGVIGGKNGEGKALPFFMVRIRIPNGLLQSHQLRTIASVTEKYARGTADLTVRQNIQLHWVTIQDLPELLDGLWRAGLTTMGSCGDDTRNITGCPLAGVDADEIYDASPLALEANRFFVGNGDFYNLPRKFKICITGCNVWCAYPEINDVGLTAIRRRDSEVGFSLRIGGGLSTDPHLAVRLNAFVQRHQVIPVLKGVAEIFRESEKLRENRERARLKFLFLKHGWTAESFQEELERRIGFHLDPAVEEKPPADIYRDHVGIHPQKQAGIFIRWSRRAAGANLSPADACRGRRCGPLWRRRAAHHQHAEPADRQRAQPQCRARWRANSKPTRCRSAASPFWRGVVACSGTEFCKIAITETKSFSRWLVEELEERLPGFEQHLKLHVTGCPNSCGQHWIADIGIEGKKIKVDGRQQDAYYFCVGGAVGLHQSVARAIGYRCLASEVPDAIERLLRRYLDERSPEENLRHYFARRSDEELRECLAGKFLAAVERDPSPGKVPHAVEG